MRRHEKETFKEPQDESVVYSEHIALLELELGRV